MTDPKKNGPVTLSPTGMTWFKSGTSLVSLYRNQTPILQNTSRLRVYLTRHELGRRCASSIRRRWKHSAKYGDPFQSRMFSSLSTVNEVYIRASKLFALYRNRRIGSHSNLNFNSAP